MQVCVFGNPFELRQTAHVGRVRADNIDSLLLEQFLEVLAQIDLFAGMNGRGCAHGEVAVEIGKHVGHIVAGD